MLASPILRAAGGPSGFMKRSIDEFSRQAGMAVRMDGLRRPTKAYSLIDFEQPGSVDRCKIMCDRTSFGGFSTAVLSHQPGTAHSEQPEGFITNKDTTTQTDGRMTTNVRDADPEPAHAIFKGTISIDLPPNRPDVQRSGFAAFRTQDRGWWMFGKLLWDVDAYGFLALRVKSDGRKYFVNIQTESIVPTDIHQHLLPSRRPGSWETVMIPLSAFVRTNHGMVVEPQKEMLRQKVRSVGIGLIDRVPGPFELCVANVYATNRMPTGEALKDGETGFDADLVEAEKRTSPERSSSKKHELDQL